MILKEIDEVSFRRLAAGKFCLMTVTTDCILKNETSWRELEKDLKIRKFLIVPTQTLVGFNSTS